ncbi:glutamyl-tRNA(Gln) amidotransferase subunit A, mitochondrial [Centruroides vittatus]|uniref:glutamyl-tRNA(Gln) amidotransferase subunit A, mitochondrial n=1 Tax=Centruroides vittatus TaxID=120091 RepID=UPI00350FFE7A
MTSILTRSIIEVSEHLQSGLLTSTELLNLCLERVKKTECLNAFITITEELARKQASTSDERYKKGKRLGMLDGIPIAVKDNFNIMGVRTTCGSNMLKNYISPYNATVIQHLCNQGAVIIGKTNMDEFAMGSGTIDSIFGPTKNPYYSGLKFKLIHRNSINDTHLNTAFCKKYGVENDWYISGGSSGGSAVALTTGTCFGALGSDTGGSTRNPASRCGVVGFKPTYGLLSRHGLIPLTNSMDVPGILVRTVDDVSLILDVLAGHDQLDSTTVSDKLTFYVPDEISIKDMHIGIPKEYHCFGLSNEVVEIWTRIADLFERNGAIVSSVSLPHTQYSIVCYSILNSCEVASNFARYDGIEYGHKTMKNYASMADSYAASRHEGFSEVVRGRILAGNYFLLKENYEKYFVQAMKVRRLILNDFQNVFKKGIDFLLTPVTLTDAPLYSNWITKDNREQVSVEDFCTQPVNMAGIPAVSLPCGFSNKGLPLSLQIIGQSFQEKKLLIIAKWLEQQLNFPLWDLNE